jgi:vacuolar-type H+-ATPase subunit I/STV1
MGKSLSMVKEYATIAFTLLGVLFGMMIMTFIFGQLGPSSTGLTLADPGYNESLDVQNNSLQGIVSYTANSTTQFNTVSIAVILILLIGVFLLFWGIFVANKKKSSSGSSGGNFGNY